MTFEEEQAYWSDVEERNRAYKRETRQRLFFQVSVILLVGAVAVLFCFFWNK